MGILSARRAIIPLAATLLIAGVGGVAWLASPRTQTFLTDADTIREPARLAARRTVLWQPPARLPIDVINTSEEHYEPRLSWDGLTLFFVRGKAGGDADIFTCRRTPAGWSAPAPLDGVNSAYDDLGPEPTADGRALYFYSDRPGGSGGYDLWVARRSDESAEFSVPTNLGSSVNGEFNDYGPAVRRDGQRLYFASNRPQPGDARQPDPHAWPATLREDVFRRTYDLYSAAITDQGLQSAEPLVALNTPYNEGSPAVSDFGDFVYFSSDRPSGRGGFDLYRSRNLRGALQPPENLGETVNSSANELDPGLALGGYALYFSSDRATTATQPAVQAEAARNYNVYYTSSREVYSEDERGPAIDWRAALAALWPQLLWGLLALLLLLALLAYLRDMRNRRLNLLTKCLLFSLGVHLLMMLLFSFWQVTAGVVGALRRGAGPIQVALAAPARGDDITTQIRGDLTDFALPAIPSVESGRVPIAFDVPAPPRHVNLDAPTMRVNDVRAPVTLDAAVRQTTTPPPDVPSDSSPALAQLAIPHAEAPNAIQDAEPTVAVVPPEALRLNRAEPVLPTSQPASTLRHVALAPQSRTPSIDRDAGPLPIPPHLKSDVPNPPGVPPDAASPDLTLAIPRSDSPSAVEQSEAVAAVVTPDMPLPTRAAAVFPTSQPLRSAQPVVLTPDVRRPDRDRDTVPRPIALAPRPSASPSPSLDGEQENGAAPKLAGLPNLALPPVESSETPRPASASGHGSENEVERGARASVSAPVPRAALPAAEGNAGASHRADKLSQVQPDLRQRSGVGSDRMPLASIGSPAVGRGGLTKNASTTPPGAPSGGLALALPSETASAASVAPGNGGTEPAPLGEERHAQRAPERRAPLLQEMGGSAETEKAVASALKWLAAHQSADGRWDGEKFDRGCGQCDGAAENEVSVATTGLALLCFFGADHTHAKDGPYRVQVQRGLDWLLKQQAKNGDLRRDEETMYSHGIATIALAEAYNMTRDPRLADPLRRAVAFICAAQHAQSGGWRYDPGDIGDTSVLGWQVMALKSAESAGVAVPSEIFGGARRWFETVADPSRPGRYGYRPGRGFTAAMTAEGMFVQQLLGVSHDDARMQASAAFLVRHLADWREQPNSYYWYYATLALFQHQGDAWKRWNQTLSRQLIAEQIADGKAAGSWPPVGEWASTGGRVYQTALCTLMLEVYYRYLPMYRTASR